MGDPVLGLQRTALRGAQSRELSLHRIMQVPHTSNRDGTSQEPEKSSHEYGALCHHTTDPFYHTPPLLMLKQTNKTSLDYKADVLPHYPSFGLISSDTACVSHALLVQVRFILHITNLLK